MQEPQNQERREYVRAPLKVDIEFMIVGEDEFEAIRRSELESCNRLMRQRVSAFDPGALYEPTSIFNSNLVDFLIHLDDKLDRILKQLPKMSGHEASTCDYDKDEKDFFVGLSLDISGTGMNAVCDKLLEPGQILRASFMISRFPVIPIVLFGKVMRVNSIQEDGRDRYKIVVNFLDLDEDDREKIIAYTFQVQRDTIRRGKRGVNE